MSNAVVYPKNKDCESNKLSGFEGLFENDDWNMERL